MKDFNRIEKMAYNLEEFAFAVGLHRNSVVKLVNSGEIFCIKVGRRVVIPKASLEKFLSGESK